MMKATRKRCRHAVRFGSSVGSLQFLAHPFLSPAFLSQIPSRHIARIAREWHHPQEKHQIGQGSAVMPAVGYQNGGDANGGWDHAQSSVGKHEIGKLMWSRQSLLFLVYRCFPTWLSISLPSISDTMSGPFHQDHKTAVEKDVEHSPSPPMSEQDVAAAYNLDEKRILKKLDRHLLPGVCVLYLLSFLDRSNVANARLEGLLEDDIGLSMTPNEYLTGLTVFFIGYILLEVLCEYSPTSYNLHNADVCRECHFEANGSQNLAPSDYARMGYCGYAAGCRRKQWRQQWHDWIFHR